ncbi:hypothetical protein IX39_19215 [Chryseobacterium formosense]|uniref:Uncharacterized protein n=1 Tax=Chryseobacterium formosense TaxID=236814 RepID=A0A085YZ10_9FLAO|nr:hypothetical protein [Chryseobacterium formosense]KFE97423.1 hypothetical protein IX39_19215 [Chryseobacterium formosense]SFT76385.1 hypothetical protein SAMN05421857_3148 [Chryseobacterium formosense]
MKSFLFSTLFFVSFSLFNAQIGRSDYIQLPLIRKYTQIDPSLKKGFVLMGKKETDETLIIRPENEFDLLVTSNIFVNNSVALIILCNNFPDEKNPRFKKATFTIDGKQFSYDMSPAELHYNDDLKRIMVSQRAINQNMYEMLGKVILSKNQINYTLYGDKEYKGVLSQKEILV